MPKKIKKKGKKPKKNKPSSKRWTKYDKDGKRLAKFCPRCGPGIFLMQAKDRLYCGKCHYTSFISQSSQTSQKETKTQ